MEEANHRNLRLADFNGKYVTVMFKNEKARALKKHVKLMKPQLEAATTISRESVCNSSKNSELLV